MASLFGRNGIARDDDQPEILSQNGTSSGTGTIRPSDIAKQARKNMGQQQQQDASGPMAGTITLFKNGFLVGDESEGDFYATETGPPCEEEAGIVKRNQGYLREIQQGYVPQMIQRRIQEKVGANGQVKIQISDRTSDTYTPPFKAFKGQGLSLKKESSGPSAYSSLSAQQLSKPSGDLLTVQVVHGRERQRVKIGRDNTLAQLFQHCLHLFPDKCVNSSRLLKSGRPPVVLTDLPLFTTCGEADLSRARVSVEN